jgi:hypothetical protein
MTFTFISVHQAILWAFVTIVALWFYIRMVRPKLLQYRNFQEIAQLRGTLTKRVYTWIKMRWDIAVAGVVVVSPSIWNGFLDAIIWLSLHATELLPAFQGADLSGLIMPKWLETSIRLGAPMAPIVRSWLLANDGDDK